MQVNIIVLKGGREMNNKLQISKVYSLSPMQEGMLFHSQINSESDMYFEQLSFDIIGILDLTIFEKCFNLIIDRYDVFRTIFVYEKLTKPQQVVIKERKTKVYVEDISRLSADEQKKYIDDFMKDDRHAGFDLAKDILMRMSVIKTAVDRYRVIWSHHHILMDGWCIGLVAEDLFKIYKLLIDGKPISLEAPKPYMDYIKWLETTQDTREASAYWNRYLENYEAKGTLLTYKKSNIKNKYTNKVIDFEIDEILTNSLLNISRKNQVTFNTVFQALWGILLTKFSGINDAVFGAVVSGRHPEVEGIENMVGLFINTLPIRVKLTEYMTFPELLKIIQEANLTAEKYDCLSLAEIQALARAKNGLFDNIIAFENYPVSRYIKNSGDEYGLGFVIDNVYSFEQSNYDLNLLVEFGDKLKIKFIFNGEVYDVEKIKEIGSHIKEIAQQISENSDIYIDSININTLANKFLNEREYWLKKLSANLERSGFPIDYTRKEIFIPSTDNLSFEFDSSVYSKLKRISNGSLKRLNMILVSVVKILLYKYTGVEDIILGTLIYRSDIGDSYINSLLALRDKLSSTMTFKDFLLQVRQTINEAVENCNYPLEHILSQLDLEAGVDIEAFFETMVILENIHNKKLVQDIRANMLFSFNDTDSGIVSNIFFNANLYKKSTIERIASHLQNILILILDNPSISLADIDILSSDERKKIINEFNNTKAEYPKDKTLHELFEEQVKIRPANVAVICDGKSLTYNELNTRANQLARKLRKEGIISDSIVAIMTDRSFEMIIGLLGIVKAGGAYLPIDSNYPPDRILYMLEQCNCSIILTHSHLLDNLQFSGQKINLNNKDNYLEDGENLENISLPSNLAYIIYTSGSTGKPKGTMIQHDSVINRLNWMQKKYPISELDTILQKTPFTFDVSVWELFWWSLQGAKVCMLEPNGEKDPALIVEAVKDNNITIIHFVPSMLNAFMEYIEEHSAYGSIVSLKRVFASGEALSLQQVNKFNGVVNTINGTKLHNLYGPTEATVDVSFFDCSEGEELDLVPIGKPIDNTKLFIVDKNNNLCPIGVVGELCISGVGLARGYINLPELTSEKFVTLPFYPNERMYRTGDLCRWLWDGNIEYIGRIDHQVKIRGFRIELGEIENCLKAHINVEDAVVVAKGDGQNRYLCAYVVLNKNVPSQELRDYLLNTVPEYMIPSFFMVLDKMPLNPNGKIDRKLLPEVNKNVNLQNNNELPTNEIEKKLLQIWYSILEVDGIGTNDNFFKIGGHSLKATALVSKIHKEFNTKINLAQIFNNPTIKGIAKCIEASRLDIYSSIEKVKEQEYYPVSASQKRIYILNQLECNGIAYNMPWVMKIDGILDMDRFEKALKMLIERHEALRTSFSLINGEPVQYIHREVEFKIEVINIDSKNPKEAINNFIRPFNLERAPLLRVGIAKFDITEHLLLIDMHHIISDGVSSGILMKDFISLYEGEELSKLRIQFKDFAAWQNNLIESEMRNKQGEYWENVFSGEIPVLNLPTDYQRPNIMSFEGDFVDIEINKEIASNIKKLAHEKDATLFMVLLAAYNVFLSKLTGQEDIVVGAPVAGRKHVDLDNIIGMFVNTVVFRNYPNANKTLNDFLEEVKSNSLKVFENQDYPFELILDKLNVKRDMSRNPLFDTMFNMLNIDNAEIVKKSGTGGLKFQKYNFESNTTKFDLTMYITEMEDSLRIRCNYRTSLFRGETIDYLMSEFIALLDEIGKNYNKTLGEYNIFSSNNIRIKKNDLLLSQKFDKNYINQSIVEHFENIVITYPQKLAVKSSCNSNELSYDMLNRISNKIARTVLSGYCGKYKLSRDEKTRYMRQMRLDGWGIESQEKLKSTTVFVAGAGGSGSPLIMQLALCGIGKIIVSDFDVVELSNLNRQFLHDESRVGLNKAISAKLTISKINPNIEVVACTERIDRDNVSRLVGEAEMIFDNVDELETKFILSECAVSKKIPHIISSMIDINSYAAIFYPPKTPCFHCLYDKKEVNRIEEIKKHVKNYKKVPNPVASPSLFLSTGFVCNEAIKILLGFANPAYNKYFLFNQKASSDISKTDGFRIVTHPFSKHFLDICKEQGFDWNNPWKGNYVEEIDITPDTKCPICSKNRESKHYSNDLENAQVEIQVLNDERTQGDILSEDTIHKKEDLESNVDAVALLYEHDIEMILGILGVLKSGKVYVPLDTSYPEERLVYILEDSGARMVLTNNKNFGLAEKLVSKVNKNIKIVNTDNIKENIADDNLNIKIDPKQAAYILYTSGSTGVPKGVVQNHCNVLYYIQNYTNKLNINYTDRITLFSSYSHDAAVVDIFTALLNGASLHPFNLKSDGSTQRLPMWMELEGITVYHSIPTVYRHIISYLTDNSLLSKIRLVVLGGESVFKCDVLKYKQVFSDDCIFVNLFGSSEASITMLNLIDKSNEITNNSVPLGDSINGTEILIIDGDQKEARVFGTGELVFKSEHLALGYWNLPEKSNVFDKKLGTFKSGDMGRLLADGSVEYIGRNDLQVKIRGHRVELGEIEQVLGEIEEIEEVVTTCFRKDDVEQFLVVYYTTKNRIEIEVSEIRRFLECRLPEYLIPSFFIYLEDLPKTPGGKIKRQGLPDPINYRRTNKSDITPLDELEKKITNIWQNVLDLDGIGVNDDFFNLGGHSLLAIKLEVEMKKNDLFIEYLDVYKHRTIRELATFIKTMETENAG